MTQGLVTITQFIQDNLDAIMAKSETIEISKKVEEDGTTVYFKFDFNGAMSKMSISVHSLSVKHKGSERLMVSLGLQGAFGVDLSQSHSQSIGCTQLSELTNDLFVYFAKECITCFCLS